MRIIALIVRERCLPRKYVKQVLSQDKISANQLALLTGRTPSSIFNLSKPKERKRALLTRIYPYPDKATQEKSGPVFIQLNQSCLEFIKSSIKNK